MLLCATTACVAVLAPVQSLTRVWGGGMRALGHFAVPWAAILHCANWHALGLWAWAHGRSLGCRGPAGACTGALHGCRPGACTGAFMHCIVAAGRGPAPVHCGGAGRRPAPVHLAMAKPRTGALQAGGLHRCTASGTRKILPPTLGTGTPHLRQRLNFCNCRAVRLAISIKFDVFRMARNHEVALV